MENKFIDIYYANCKIKDEYMCIYIYIYRRMYSRISPFPYILVLLIRLSQVTEQQ